MSSPGGGTSGRRVIEWPMPGWSPLVLTSPPLIPLRHPRKVVLTEPRHLTDEELTWLRIGLGYSGTDRRWMVRLDATNELHLCRSWTGHEIFRATIAYPALGPAVTEVLIDAESQEHDGKVVHRFLQTLDRLIALRARLTDAPSTPQAAWAASADPAAPWSADLPLLASAVRSALPFRVRRIRVLDESADAEIEIVDVVVDGDAVLLLCRDGGRIWLVHPWRWVMTGDALSVVNGDVLLWPAPAWGLDPELASWSAWFRQQGTGARKLDWHSRELAPVDNFVPGMTDLILEIVGTPNAPEPTVPALDEPALLAKLVDCDPAWAGLAESSGHSVGRRTLQVAAEIVDRGARVTPGGPDDFCELRIQVGGRTIRAFVNDYGSPEDAVWARLIETIGPFRECVEIDRALADFSIHGPFERNVVRREGQVWVEIRVRLADVATAFLDLDNLSMVLTSTLGEAARGQEA